MPGFEKLPAGFTNPAGGSQTNPLCNFIFHAYPKGSAFEYFKTIQFFSRSSIITENIWQ